MLGFDGEYAGPDTRVIAGPASSRSPDSFHRLNQYNVEYTGTMNDSERTQHNQSLLMESLLLP